MELFIFGLITGCVLTVLGYLFRNKIATKAQNEVDAVQERFKAPKPPKVP